MVVGPLVPSAASALDPDVQIGIVAAVMFYQDVDQFGDASSEEPLGVLLGGPRRLVVERLLDLDAARLAILAANRLGRLLKSLLDRQIAELEVRIEQTMASDDDLATTAGILRSVPGIGLVASSMLIAGLPSIVTDSSNTSDASCFSHISGASSKVGSAA